MRCSHILQSNRYLAPSKLFLLFALANALVFLSMTILTILAVTRKSNATRAPDTHPTTSTPDQVQHRHVNNDLGPSGTLTVLTRLRDAIGTAVQTWGFGPGRKHQLRHTRTTSPLPSVYRDTVSALTESRCSHSGSGCELLTRGFATVGVVRYTFSAERENIVGSSTQVQTACRCVGHECDKAILMRPVNISARAHDGTVLFTGTKSCIYQLYEGKFTDCHAETLRMQARASGDRAPSVPGYFDFRVNASQYDQGFWKAAGHRGWDYGCLERDFYSLPSMNFSVFQVSNVSSGIHEYPVSRPEGIPSLNESVDCRAPPGVTYFRDADEREGEECAATFQFAMAGASFLGTQMDEVAIGKNPLTYLREPPILLVFWEIMILICAASLGLYFAISAYLKFKKKRKWTWACVLKVLGVQLMSLIFEGLPLYFALSFESVASQWAGRFAYMGGTVALRRDLLQPQAATDGNILVLTAVVGESRFMWTQLLVVGMFTAVINLAAVVILALVFWAFVENRGRQREQDEGAAESEEELRAAKRWAAGRSSSTLSSQSLDDLF